MILLQKREIDKKVINLDLSLDTGNNKKFRIENIQNNIIYL